MNRWSNNHNHKYFMGNQVLKTAPFIRFPQAIIYQLSNHHSQQYINYHFNNSLCYCCSLYLAMYVIALYLFHIKWLFINLFSFHIQTKYSDTHAYVYSWSPNDGDRNQQKTNFWACFFCNIFILVNNLIHWYNIFYWQVHFRWNKVTNKTTILLVAHLLYNMILHW